MTTHKQKQRIYRKIMEQSVADAYRNMQAKLVAVPEGANLDEDEIADHAVRDVWAIEEEWIIDPELRLELSLVQCDDDNDNDDEGHYA